MERLKNGGTVLTKKYFEEQLERIREIRISERNFYQKLTDIYATSLDYDRNALTTKECFCEGTEQDALCCASPYGGRADL